MENLHLKIVSPEKTLFDGKVVFIKLPGTEGDFSFLSNHAPFISSLTQGSILYKLKDDAENILKITSGFVEILNNDVTVCVEGILS